MGVRGIQPLVAGIAVLAGPTGPCGRRIVRAVVVKHVRHHLKPPGVVDRHGTDLTSMFAPTCDSPSRDNTRLLKSVVEDVPVRAVGVSFFLCGTGE